MKMDLTNPLCTFFKWLNKEVEPIQAISLSDFNKLRYELRACDVLLIEGRNRISQMIKVITRSSWSHAALYMGRLYDIDEDKTMQKRITEFYTGDPSEQLIFESLLGKGAILSPLKKYEKEHIRICRPKNISYQSVNFPVLPLFKKNGKNSTLYENNPRLYSPRDFDYSPYFDIIKYPMHFD